MLFHIRSAKLFSFFTCSYLFCLVAIHSFDIVLHKRDIVGHFLIFLLGILILVPEDIRCQHLLL